MPNTQPPISFLPIPRRAVLALVFACLPIPSYSVDAQTFPTISGRVTNAEGEPLAGVTVYVYQYYDFSGGLGYWNDVAHGKTNEDGVYTVTVYVDEPEAFRLGFSPQWGSYRGEYYNNKRSRETPDDIVIAAGDQLTGYDATLAYSGRIVGTVVNPDGNGVEGVEVQALRDNGVTGPEVELTTVTDVSGNFALTMPLEAEYWLRFNDQSGLYLDEYYNNKYDLWTSDRLVVPAEEVITLTAQLNYPPSLSGTVVDNQGVPVSNVIVYLYKKSGDVWDYYLPGVFSTDENGVYSITELDIGAYRLQFWGMPIVEEFYQDQTSLDTADIIDFTNNPGPVVANAVVTRRGIMTGTVTNFDGEPLEYAHVTAYFRDDDEWEEYTRVDTNENGYYQVAGSPQSEYRISFERYPYATEYYNNATTIAKAQSITVPLETIAPNINAVMRLNTEVEADFSGIPRTGIGSLPVVFSDYSRGGIISQEWNFGDGTTSTEISPTHTYTVPGVYTVSLKVVGAENRHFRIKTSYISVADAPITDLDIEQGNPGSEPEEQPSVGQTIYFSATAGGSNVEYLWDFGDETLVAAATATGQYVQHSYEAAGSYTVTPTARNGADEQVATMPIIVKEADSGEDPVSALALHGPDTARVNDTITFSATVATGDNVSYSWDFGDDGVGAGQVVSHTYTAAGSYTVTVTASNSQGENKDIGSITVEHALLLPRLER